MQIVVRHDVTDKMLVYEIDNFINPLIYSTIMSEENFCGTGMSEDEFCWINSEREREENERENERDDWDDDSSDDKDE